MKHLAVSILGGAAVALFMSNTGVASADTTTDYPIFSADWDISGAIKTYALFEFLGDSPSGYEITGLNDIMALLGPLSATDTAAGGTLATDAGIVADAALPMTFFQSALFPDALDTATGVSPFVALPIEALQLFDDVFPGFSPPAITAALFADAEQNIYDDLSAVGADPGLLQNLDDNVQDINNAISELFSGSSSDVLSDVAEVEAIAGDIMNVIGG